MKTIIIDIETAQKAKELSHVLEDMKFVKRVSVVDKRKDIIDALVEHESIKDAIVKKKNSAIAKYL